MTYAEYREQKTAAAKTVAAPKEKLTPYQKYKQQRKVTKLPYEETEKKTVVPLSNEKKSTWFQKGAFSDGYQFGDVTRTILGSGTDLKKNVLSGIIGIGEKVVDTLAYLAPYAAEAQFNQNGGYYNLQNAAAFQQQNESAKQLAQEFVAKDLYDEDKVAAAAVDKSPGVRILKIDTQKHSVFGDKADGLAKSGGELVAAAGLQAVGVPWLLTSGVSSFGSEAESALKQGASYEEAGLSATVTAGSEVLTEKISGGIKFGKMGTLDKLAEGLLDKLQDKTIRYVAKLGLDVTGEGLEEVLSGAVSKFGQWLTYQDDKTLEELYLSEEAREEAVDAFLGGAFMGGVGNLSQTVLDAPGNTRYKGETNRESTALQETEASLSSADIQSLDPKTRRAAQEYQKHQQQRDTIQSLLQNEQSRQQSGKLSQAELQQSQNRVDQLNKLLSREQNTLYALEQKYHFQPDEIALNTQDSSNVQNRRETDVENSTASDKMELDGNTTTDITSKEEIRKQREERMARNRQQGADFEHEMEPVLKQHMEDMETQITIQTSVGRVRVDAIGFLVDEQGNRTIRIVELKSSETARLSKNQQTVFREIAKNGGVVVGKGKNSFTGGKPIPPGTVIEIVRGTKGGNWYVSNRFE